MEPPKQPAKTPSSGVNSSFVGRSAFHRINFLYQAGCLMAAGGVDEKTGRVLNAHYGQILSKVAKKSVLRMAPEVKRNVCKGCGAVGRAGTVRKKRKGQVVRCLCDVCGTCKVFGAKADKPQVWHLRPESVHAEIKEDRSKEAVIENKKQ